MYATPWEDPRTLNFVLLSGLIGLAAFCGSYAWNVWRRRNATSQTTRGRRGRLVAGSIGGCGLAVVLGVLALREVSPPVGHVVAERLYIVRAREDYQVVSLSDAQRVQKGDIIARLHSPPVAAESSEFAARIAEERADRAKAEVLPLDFDDELVRRHQNAISRQQQFRASRDQILPARESVALLKTQGELERREKLAHLEDERQTVLGDLKIAAARHTLAQDDLRRIEQLGRRNAVTPGQLEEARTRLLAIAEEVAKLNARSTALGEEIAQVERSRVELAAECDRQLARYAEELKRIDAGLADAASAEAGLEQMLASDRSRAEKAKSHDLARLAAKIDQSQAKRTGAMQTLEISAPFAGSVAYRERSPNTAEPQDALLVIGQDDGLVLRLRLPVDQVHSLEAAGRIEAELVGLSLIPYFSATYLRHTALEQRPNYAVVELACRLPGETVRDVVQGRRVAARLLWRPPLWTSGPFNVGVAMLVVGIVGWCASGRLSARPATTSAAGAQPRASANGHRPSLESLAPEAGASDRAARFAPPPAPRELEYGELAASLRMLGDRLRTSLLQGELDDHLIAAVEWALDRHQARAVEMLADAVGDDDLLASAVAALLDVEFHTRDIKDGSGLSDSQLPRRLSRILATIAPGLLDRETADR